MCFFYALRIQNEARCSPNALLQASSVSQDLKNYSKDAKKHINKTIYVHISLQPAITKTTRILIRLSFGEQVANLSFYRNKLAHI